jgi:hypothetical protein
MPVKEGLLAQPANAKEKEACSKKLTPSDLFKIIVSKSIDLSSYKKTQRNAKTVQVEFLLVQFKRQV